MGSPHRKDGQLILGLCQVVRIDFLFVYFSCIHEVTVRILTVMGSRSIPAQKKQSTVREWPTRRIAVLAVSPMHLTTLGGPVDVLARASAALSRAGERKSPAYEIQLLTGSEAPLMTPAGIGLVGGRPWWEAGGPIDTLLVFAGAQIKNSKIDPDLLLWIREQSQRVRRIASVCAGAFVLAEAGLLDGRQATTHWQLADVLARRYPRVSVDGDRIYTQDGNIWTSAGVTAGIDLALALVEEDFGHTVALNVARSMVVFLRRSGGQKQFSTQLAAQAGDYQPIRELVAWISDNLDSDLSVPALARRVAMSGRNFSRVFTQQVNETPARFVARLRTEAAQSKLVASNGNVEVIALDVGFGDGETFRRRLRSEVGASPIAYRTQSKRAGVRVVAIAPSSQG
jgi:transcriptional regulator GlxA family with amidase domain